MCSELLSGKIVSTLLPRARSSSTWVARSMPHSSGIRDLPPNGDSTSTRPYPAARSSRMLPAVGTDEEWQALVWDEKIVRHAAEELAARLGLASAGLRGHRSH